MMLGAILEVCSSPASAHDRRLHEIVRIDAVCAESPFPPNLNFIVDLHVHSFVAQREVDWQPSLLILQIVNSYTVRCGYVGPQEQTIKTAWLSYRDSCLAVFFRIDRSREIEVLKSSATGNNTRVGKVAD